MIVAHAGHWVAGALYLAPVVAIVAALELQARRDRRRDAQAERARQT